MNRSTCASGQGVRALGLDRVLGREDEERVRDRVGLVADRDLALLHHLEQRALDLGRRAVDLVGEEEVREDGPERGRELARLLVVDPGPDEVRRHEVGRELDPLEVAADRLRERLDRHRLGEARHALDEQVAAGEQGDEHPLEQVVLADDDLLDLVQEPLHRDGAGRGVRAVGSGSTGAPPRCGRLSTLGRPAAPPATSMGTARPMPMNTSCWVGLMSAVTMPTTRAVAVEQRPAGVAGVDRGVHLDEAAHDVVGRPGSRNERSRPDTTPALSEP